MTDSESRESHQPTLARFGDAVKLDRAACHHKRTKRVGVRTSNQRTNSVSCWWYKQALSGSCLSGSKVELCKGTVCRVFAGNDGGFFHFLIFHDSDTVTTRDFSCVGSWLNVIFRSSGGSQVWFGWGESETHLKFTSHSS